MSDAERDKWDERYRDGAYEGRTHPTALLAEWLPFLPRGPALDVACGAGRNALFLASAGFAVDARDISTVALERGRRAAVERGLTIDWRAADFDDRPELALRSSYAVIVWVRYVNRALLPALIARLNPGGHLICEQHLETAADVAGPRSPGFRLRAGELREAAGRLAVRYYNEGLVVDPDGRTVALAQLVARARA
ncbi:MAG TPA: methyltransferase domain-containing protein [Gammaproteobacteria bacterium]|nr:methyltransferase domain-containing protein [Gammaproteobacteria bacterium]